MRHNRKWIALLLGSAMVLSMITGCGKSSGKSDSDNTQNTTDQKTESQFVGLWQYYDYKNGYELKSDHTFAYYHSNSSSDDEGGTWKENGDTVTLTYNNKDLAAIELTLDSNGDLVDPESDALYKTDSFDFIQSSSTTAATAAAAVEESTEDLSDESQFNGDDDSVVYDSDPELWDYVGIWQLQDTAAGFYCTSSGHWYGVKTNGTWASGTWTGNDTGIVRTSTAGDTNFTLTDGALVTDEGDAFYTSDGSEFLIDTSASNFLDQQWQYSDSQIAFYISGLHQYTYLNNGVIDTDLSGYWIMNEDGTISLHAYGHDDSAYKVFTYNEDGTITDADGKVLSSVTPSAALEL